METSFDYDVVEKPQEKKEENIASKEYADIVYIFTSPDKPGIRFYDKSPSGAVARLTGFLPKGKFITNIHSISEVKWDSNINEANTARKVKTENGELAVKTIMVSEKQFNLIMGEIIRQNESDTVVIDTIDRSLENELNYEKSFQPNYNSISNDQQYDNVDHNKNDLSEESSSFKI